MKSLIFSSSFALSASCFCYAGVLYQDSFDNDGLKSNTGVGGGAANRTIQGHSWDDDGEATFSTVGTNFTRRALLYSQNTFQSETGFRLSVQFETGSIGDTAAHSLSFGLISSDTDVSTYAGFNPFKSETGIYSIGANVTADGSAAGRGLNFTDGSTITTLDQSGTNVQFTAGEPCTVEIEIGIGGYWCYRINGEYEASGVLLDGFDFSKDYRVVVYGQDDNGGGKEIQSIQLENAPAAGERADHLRGTWHITFKTDNFQNGLVEDISLDPYLDQIKDLKTVDSVALWLSGSATKSSLFTAPHRLLESFWYDDSTDRDANGEPIKNLVVPRWGNGEEPENDMFGDWARALRAQGLGVKVYLNSENIVGRNLVSYEDVSDRWKEFCDTNPEAQAFINSQPFHLGTWNGSTYEVEYNSDGSLVYPNRKYFFCFAEFILKDYSLRYGDLITSWIFDSATDINDQGDVFTTGNINTQRIYQAFANAARVGNPNIPVSFQNGRSTANYFATPFQLPSRFDDFSFGHAFGGNGDHANKITGHQFSNNYRHVTRMIETGGSVYDGGNDMWDDQIVGNFHSKHSTTSWSGGSNQAWEQDDYNQWNLEAMQAGGSMTWGVSHLQNSALSNNFNMLMRDWSFNLAQGLDDYLAEFENPGTPNWARAYTVLPDGVTGRPYRHVLIENEDFWDPEGDEIDVVWFSRDAPDWLTIHQDPDNPGQWIISGTPGDQSEGTYTFRTNARDVNRKAGRREVELVIKGSAFPVMESKGIKLGASWNEISPTNGEPYLEYDNNATTFRGRAISYSTASYQSDGGFRLSVNYTTGDIGDTGAHNLSFGLIRDTLNFGEYEGNNPFGRQPEVYSLGVNVTADRGIDLRGLNFTDGTTITNLDQSGTSVEFPIDESTEVILEIGQGGVWEYSIDGITEASGTIPGGFDLSENYRIVVYGQDDNGGGKTLQSIQLQYLEPLNLDGYESWSLGEFNELGVDKSGDSDGDQLGNLLEYVLGGDPRTFDQDIGPQMSSGIFSFSRRRDSVTDTAQQFQYSTDLQTWFGIDLSDPSSSRVTVEDLDGDMEKVEVSINPEWVEEGKIFTRLQVE